jgi:serine/threonine protein kinase
MAGLSHAHIAVLYGVETWRGTPVLLLEYLAGGTLAVRLQSAALDVATALAIVKSLAAALAHVHRSGNYHGDIKPSNIGFTVEGIPKFLDFGLSQAIASAPASEGTRHAIAGTPAYLSPEVRGGAAPGPELDLWALSLVLCESLAGSLHPGSVDTPEEILARARAAARTLPPSVPEPLRQFLGDAFADDPGHRPGTADQFLQQLSIFNFERSQR